MKIFGIPVGTEGQQRLRQESRALKYFHQEIFLVDRNIFTSHDYRQLYDYGEMLNQAVRVARCLDVFHGLPVTREIEGGHREAEDVEGDDDEDDQVIVEKFG